MKILAGNVELTGVHTVENSGGAVENEASTKQAANLESISALMTSQTKKTRKINSNMPKKIYLKPNANVVSNTATLQ